MGRKCYGRAGLALSLLGWLGFAGCVGCSDESQTTSIEIDGSSTVYRLSVGVYEVFRETDPSIKVMVNYAGTGAGFGKFVKASSTSSMHHGRSSKTKSTWPARTTSSTSSCPSRSTR